VSAGSERRRVTRIRAGAREVVSDLVATEEPLVIEVDGRVVSTTMRTPGHDLDLTLGWLVSEGVVTGSGDVVTAQECVDRPSPDQESRLVRVVTRSGKPPEARLTPTSSACGICGADLVGRTLAESHWSLAEDRVQIRLELLLKLPDLLREAQRGFAGTGGSHAAGLFDAAGQLVVVREDVGRHNAVDKAIGHCLARDLLPLRGHVLQVSGRASAELVHKAVRAGIPIMAAVSAPSTLAVDLARAAGLTLVGFSRGGGCNIYSGAERITD
jgi:formate dehydrogenase accessory protein FdhD